MGQRPDRKRPAPRRDGTRPKSPRAPRERKSLVTSLIKAILGLIGLIKPSGTLSGGGGKGNGDDDW